MTHKKSQPEGQPKSNIETEYNDNCPHGPITIQPVKGEPRVDSRIIAEQLGVQHNSTMRLLKRYQNRFERWGVFGFEIHKPKSGSKGGRSEKFTLLNENQAFFLLTLTDNTERTVQLKSDLVEAFRLSREKATIHDRYLPFYHDCHNQVDALVKQSGSTTPKSTHHRNIERLINLTFGLSAGERAELPARVKLDVMSAQRIVSEVYGAALGQGINHKLAYKEAKARLAGYVALVAQPALGVSYEQ